MHDGRRGERKECVGEKWEEKKECVRVKKEENEVSEREAGKRRGGLYGKEGRECVRKKERIE